MILFFFSSRRRHTRLTCDWSSDVCSSDLEAAATRALGMGPDGNLYALTPWSRQLLRIEYVGPAEQPPVPAATDDVYVASRSEERRVGKECRDRGGQAT